MEIKGKSSDFLLYNQFMQTFETDHLRCQSLSMSDYSDFEVGIEPRRKGFAKVGEQIGPEDGLEDGPELNCGAGPAKTPISRWAYAQPPNSGIGMG